MKRLRTVLNLAQWPTRYAVVLGLADGVLTVLNQTTFDFPTAAKTTITILLGALSFLGIGPLLGPKFKAALHLPAKVATGVGFVLVVLMVVVQQDANLPYSAIVLGVINVAGGLGFDPAYIPTV